MDHAVFGYIRVSQAEGASGLATQSRILTDHGLRDDRIFTDVTSGRTMRRPAGRPPGTRGCHDDPSRGPRPVRRRRQRHGSGCGQRHVAQHPSVLQVALEQVAGLDEGPGFAGTAVKLAMLSAPLGHGVQAARAAQHGAHCHGQYGSQGMTNPPGAARVGTWDKASLNPNATSTFPSSPHQTSASQRITSLLTQD